MTVRNPAGNTCRLKEGRLESPYGGEMASRRELRGFAVGK